MTRPTRGLAVAATLTLTCSLIVAWSGSPAQAVDGSQWNPGNIVSDQQFYDGNAMTPAQIQAFLDAKAPVCDTNHPASDSPFTCLKDYRQDTVTRPADAYCTGTYQGASNELASTIIAKVSAACNISAKAILVTLQKEQGLVTNTWPSQYRYDTAMGYGCPDTSGCATEYYGFQNQVWRAARQFQRYRTTPGSYNFGVGVYLINSHPATWNGSSYVYNCPAQSVDIQNLATAGLYNYTPYVPNAAAIAAGYGTGDTCSSYGNRNFWRYWWDWFGDPRGPEPLHGAIAAITGGNEQIRVTGWSLDPYDPAPGYIWINVDGVGGPALANKPWAIDTTMYPTLGGNHGFDVQLAATPGTHQVCVYGYQSKLLGCETVTVTQAPQGQILSVTAAPGQVHITGWSTFPGSTASSYVWINVDGVGAAYRADLPSIEAAAANPDLGNLHGFDVTLGIAAGSHRICAYQAATSRLLSCVTVAVPGTTASSGALESVTATPNAITVTGWWLNPASSDTGYVWVNIDGVGGPLKANQTSASSLASYPSLGNNHGYAATLPVSAGNHNVCVYTTFSVLIACQTIVVPVSMSPTGAINELSVAGFDVTVSGWSLDPTSTASGYVWVNVDGTGGAAKANLESAAAQASYPATGSLHGFSEKYTLAAGNHTICVYNASNAKLISCKSAAVKSPVLVQVDSATGTADGINVTGWAVNTASTDTVYLWINVDGSGRAYKADAFLNWIDLMFGQGSNHGFNVTIPASPGTHQVCVYDAKSAVLSGCRTATMP